MMITTEINEEESILSLAKTGDSESINKVLSTIRPYIEAKVNGLLKRPKWQPEIDLESVVQTITYEVWKSIHNCKATTWKEFMGWVMKVSSNKSLHAIEKACAKKRGGHIKIIRPDFDSCFSTDDDVGESVFFSESFEMLERMIVGDKKSLAVLDYIASGGVDRINSRQLAELTGFSLSTACSDIRRFRAIASNVLQNHCNHTHDNAN